MNCWQVEHFAVFDPDTTNSVFVLEVITLLLLFCNGELAPCARRLARVATCRWLNTCPPSPYPSPLPFPAVMEEKIKFAFTLFDMNSEGFLSLVRGRVVVRAQSALR